MNKSLKVQLVFVLVSTLTGISHAEKANTTQQAPTPVPSIESISKDMRELRVLKDPNISVVHRMLSDYSANGLIDDQELINLDKQIKINKAKLAKKNSK